MVTVKPSSSAPLELLVFDTSDTSNELGLVVNREMIDKIAVVKRSKFTGDGTDRVMQEFRAAILTEVQVARAKYCNKR